MQERIEKITDEMKYMSDEFNAAKELKDELEYPTKEDLDVIEEWLEEFREKINELAGEYNREKNEIEFEKLKEKTTREQFDELRQKLKDIRNASKAMQPKFVGSAKQNKKATLERLGFIETLGAKPSRSVYIHKSLFGQYYDTLKDYLNVSKKLNEEYRETLKMQNVSNDTQIPPIELFQEELKKDKEIVSEEEKQNTDTLRYVLTEEKNEEEIVEEIPIISNTEEKIENDELTRLENERQEILKQVEENQKSLSQIQAGVGMGKKDYITYKKQKYWIPKKYINKFRLLMHKQELLGLKLKGIDDKIKIINENNFKQTDAPEIPSNSNNESKIDNQPQKLFDSENNESKIDNQPPKIFDSENNESKKTDMQFPSLIEEETKLSEESNTPNKTTNKKIEEEVKKVEKPKSNIKEKIKKNLKKILIALALTVSIGASIFSGLKNRNKKDKELIDEIPIEQTIEDEIKPTLNEDNVEEIIEPIIIPEEIEETYFTDDNKYNLNGDIYNNMYDATNQKNGKQAYFGNYTEGNIVGWGIKINDELVYVSKSEANYQEKLEYYLNQGGQVTTYAMNDINSGKINEVTGFYNVEQVTQNKSR